MVNEFAVAATFLYSAIAGSLRWDSSTQQCVQQVVGQSEVLELSQRSGPSRLTDATLKNVALQI